MKDYNFPNFIRQRGKSETAVDESLDRIDESVYNVDRRIFPRWLKTLAVTTALSTAYALLSFSNSHSNRTNYQMLNRNYSNVVEVARYNPVEASKEAGALLDKIHSLQRDANIVPSKDVLGLMKKIEADFEAKGLIIKH